jgi:hypothetical protein
MTFAMHVTLRGTAENAYKVLDGIQRRALVKPVMNVPVP